MKTALLALATLVCVATPVMAQTLPIPGIGTMKDIPGAHELPDPGLDYKIVFDVHSVADSAEEVDPALQAMAGLINTFRHDGVPATRMHIVAVFHGPTVAVIANDAEYHRRTGAKANPNDALLQQLKDAGVTLVVCGQSARAQHYDDQSLLPFVQTNLSATVTFINLETRGYVRIQE